VKLLWIGDGVKQTGFARVSHSILHELRKWGWDIAHLAVNATGDPHELPWRVYPAMSQGDLFGFNRTSGVIAKEKPDVVCILADPWVVPMYLDHIPARVKVVAYVPVDARNQWAGIKLNRLNYAIAYTAFGARELRKGGYKGPLDVVPHGIDLNAFSPMPKDQARILIGLPDELRDAFIIGNVNRNQPRKRLDLTIEYFAQWWKNRGKPHACLLFHCHMHDAGWDLLDLAKYHGVLDRIIATGSEKVGVFRSEEHLRAVYNSLDVQVSTTLGEGWGLTTMEGMACGVANAVPDSAALAEWPDGAVLGIPCDATETHAGGVNTIGAVPSRRGFVNALRMLSNEKIRHSYALAGRARVQQPEFRWERIGKQFHEILTEV
jgi:D-inositol-3-phosphate glycosyltransferase